MHRTKFKYENQQRAITQKTSKQELWFMCTAFPLMRSIHPQNFITIACIVLEIQNSSMTSTKGNHSKIKQTGVKGLVHCTPA